MPSYRLFLVIALTFLAKSTSAQSVKRLGVIDIETDTLSSEERLQILTEIKTHLNDQRLLALVRDDEVDSKLIQKNKTRIDFEKQKTAQAKRIEEIQSIIEDGQKAFRASNFDEAIHTFEKGIPLVSQASTTISSSLVFELLDFLGASHYFAGNELQAKSYFNAVFDLNPEAMINTQKFPPPVVDLYNSVRAAKRFEFVPWIFESNLRGFEVHLAGQALKVTESDTITVMVPVGHSVWGEMNVIVEKEGFVPAIFAVSNLPKEVKLLSSRDRKLVTRGLFTPLGATTPPVELKKLVVNLDLAVVFLGSATKDLEGRWLLKGQWLEGATSRTSPVEQVSDFQLNMAAKTLVSKLLNDLDGEGRIIGYKADLAPASDYQIVKDNGSGSKPFYKTWWFWSLVGAGAIGAGVGTYYLLMPPETLKVKVAQAP